jgi:hypothetical protein
MTVKRDLKRRIRERQEQTGERYTAARRAVLAQRPRVPVVELVEVTAAGRRNGLACRVLLFPELIGRVDHDVLLRRIGEVLRATEDDPATRILREVVLHGGRPRLGPTAAMARLHAARRFAKRAAAGIGGVCESGLMLAIGVDGVAGPLTVVALVSTLPDVPVAVASHRQPTLILRSADGLHRDVLDAQAWLWSRLGASHGGNLGGSHGGSHP